MSDGTSVDVTGAIRLKAPPRKAPPRKVPLPPIRDELILFAAAPNEDGTPAWMIQDPVTNRFYRIGWIDFELLVHWADNDVASLVRSVNEQTPLNVTVDDVRQLSKFLADNQLLRLSTPADVAKALARAQGMKRSFFEWLLHNYLFFRLPLVRPQRWLAALQPWLARIHMPLVAGVIGLITLVGMYLVSRQWDVFTHTLVDNMTLTGMMGYAAAMLFAKTLHELGHALVATRYGVRVAHMGVAFLVLLPMLYTDTGESWRLKDSRQRLAIAAAGISVELALAGIATLVWTLAPDGAFRNGMFFLATTSWVLTLAINASPFMRFDGYFIASDLMDLPNLHERSSALARTWMRRSLLGFDEKWPEDFPLPKRRALIGFALFTWLYRLTVFIGIALLVYYFFFKLLGILLMALELVWFIGKPVMKELEVWKKRRAEISTPRRWWLAGIALLAVGVLVFPFSSRVSGYGWFHAQNQQLIHAPFAAQIVSVPTQRQFKTGEVLFVLESSMLSIAQDKSRQMAQARGSQIAGLLGLPDGEAQRQTLNSQKAYFEAEEKMSVDEQARLTLRAPFDGELHDVDHGLAPGVWVKPREPLAILVDRKAWVIEAYIAEADLDRVVVGQAVRARLLSDPMAWTGGHIEAIDVSRTLALPSPMLDASNGGPIATVTEAAREGKERSQVVRDALFRVRIALDEPLPTNQVSTVRVSIEGKTESIASSALRKMASVFIRESGF
ncbi:HlyD family efflux transporter periplasmic adaptor subunit [Hydrogenophaga sp. A37]|uniref:HlyD family efflux transporter periplasmic adaptor subunit n=1 Tax=Hydrogenophaga sp. A37 TaxID=1945864 RepID=UPI00209A9537|nr:HlyD family efflux transporter periplasmic adaptor subunit [Hydrogenophaga sp. A37]